MLYSIVLLSLATVAVARVENVCGSNDMSNAACFKNIDFFRWPMGAIALVVYKKDGKGKACTGFLVGSGNYFMTNNHCISTQKTADTAEFKFNYQTTECGTDRKNPWDDMEISNRYTGADLVYTSRYRDSTLLKVRTGEKLHEKYGSLALSKDIPRKGEEAYIIHHPEGLAKQIAWKNCNIKSVWSNDVRHTCDALPGSSGAPMISQTRGTVVAINDGYFTGGCSGLNFGKIIKYVVDEIKEHAGEAVYNDITTSKRLEGPTVGNELHGKIFKIKSHNGRYIRAQSWNRIVSTIFSRVVQTKFQFLYQNDGTYVLKTNDGRYVRGQNDGKLTQVTTLTAQEKFHLIEKGQDKYAIRSAHHYYIQANGKKLRFQFFDKSWETFSLIEFSNW